MPSIAPSLCKCLRFTPILAGGFGMLNSVGTAVFFRFFFEDVANISVSKCALHTLMFRYKYPTSFFIRSFRLQLIAHFFYLFCESLDFYISFSIKKTFCKKSTYYFGTYLVVPPCFVLWEPKKSDIRIFCFVVVTIQCRAPSCPIFSLFRSFFR